MNKYWIRENNSGGYTKYLDCTIEDSGRPHIVIIEANSLDEAIQAFEKHVDINFDYENSYEGSSCNCCGRRFEVYGETEEESQLFNYTNYWGGQELSDWGGTYRVVKLEDAPKTLKEGYND